MPDNDKRSPRELQTALDHHEGSGSPERPSYSPVTPTLSQSSLAGQDDEREEVPPEWISEPEALPMNLDTNPDAMALRSALSILQVQRRQAIKDMQDLEHMKEAALKDPDRFVKDLQAGKLSRPPKAGIEIDDIESAAQENEAAEDASKFGKFPRPQNVLRAPPVEWAKYHVVGEPLERMHQVQQQYPGLTEAQRAGSERPQPHVVAAPYRPFADKLDEARTSRKQ
jgi:hypothetical protein